MVGSLKIAVIDDDPELVGVMEILLKTGGHEAIAAYGGEEGLELVRRDLPDLVLLDIMMPDIDGIEVCQKLKSDESTRDVAILFVSAKKGEDSYNKALAAGGSGYIVKPFKPRELLQKIEELSVEGGLGQAD